MNACPKCKGTQGYSLRVRTIGYVVHEGEWNGTHERIVDDSNMKLIGDKTVKCLDCGKRTLMKTLRAATLMLFLFALPLNAQVTQAQYDSVVARVSVLEQILGKVFLGKASSELAPLLKPENELPGGRYPYILSDYQLRVGLAEGFGGLQTQVSGLATRLAAVEARPTSSVVVPAPTTGTSQLRLGVATTESDALQTITDPDHTQIVFTGKNVNMIGISDLDHSSTQFGGHIRSNMFSLANSDGGWRLWQNIHQTNGTWGVFLPDQPSSTTASDAAASFSYKYSQPSMYGVGAYSHVSSQTFVINGAGADAHDYRESQDVSLMTMQGGRYMDFRTSGTTNDPRSALKLAPLGDDRVIVFVGGRLRLLSIDADGRPSFRDFIPLQPQQ